MIILWLQRHVSNIGFLGEQTSMLGLKVRIGSSGAYLPKRVVTSSELEEDIGFSTTRQPGWIREKTGIEERRWITGEEDLISMAVKAADMALRDSDSSIDTILVARSRYVDPRSLVLAGAVHDGLKKLGHSLEDVNYVDGFYVCTGSISALLEAGLHISSGISRSALIVASAVGSKYYSKHHPSTACLWGDGAGAIVVNASDKEGILAYKGLGIPGLWDIFPLKTDVDGRDFVGMDGRAVIQGVMQHGPKIVRQVVKDAELNLEDIALFLFHQANGNMIKRFSRELGIPEEKVFLNVNKYGNTSSAASLIAYHEAKNEGRLQDGATCAFISFSAGFYINCMIYKHSN